MKKVNAFDPKSVIDALRNLLGLKPGEDIIQEVERLLSDSPELAKVPGYHIYEIKTPGICGEISKIREELEELEDAHSQDCKVLELVELSDLIGAVQLYLKDAHPDTTIHDLIAFADITTRAFENGVRG